MLSELPKVDKEHINIKLNELMMNVVKRENGEDIVSLLDRYNGRFDKYFAEIVNSCKSSLVIHNQEYDEYFMINKDDKCINISALCENYKRLSLAEWLSRYSISYFGIPISYQREQIRSFVTEDSAYNLVKFMSIEALHIAEFNGFDSDNAIEYLERMSQLGEYTPMSSFNAYDGELNELNLVMYGLDNFLIENPLDIKERKSPKGDFEIEIYPRFGEKLSILELYDEFKLESDLHPLEIMRIFIQVINEELITHLEERL